MSDEPLPAIEHHVWICCRKSTGKPCGSPWVRWDKPEEHTHPDHEARRYVPESALKESEAHAAQLKAERDVLLSDFTIQRNLADEACRQRDEARAELAAVREYAKTEARKIYYRGNGDDAGLHWGVALEKIGFGTVEQPSAPPPACPECPKYIDRCPKCGRGKARCPECLMSDQHKLQCSRREDGGQVVVKARESDCSECGGSGVSYIAQPRTQSNKDVPCPKCTGKSPSGKGGS
jgi:hypothetical protein